MSLPARLSDPGFLCAGPGDGRTQAAPDRCPQRHWAFWLIPAQERQTSEDPPLCGFCPELCRGGPRSPVWGGRAPGGEAQRLCPWALGGGEGGCRGVSAPWLSQASQQHLLPLTEHICLRAERGGDRLMGNRQDPWAERAPLKPAVPGAGRNTRRWSFRTRRRGFANKVPFGQWQSC